MTDVTRKEILEALAEIGEIYPDWRFGQLVVNIASWSREGESPTTYDVEDAEFLKALQKHIKHRRTHPLNASCNATSAAAN